MKWQWIKMARFDFRQSLDFSSFSFLFNHLAQGDSKACKTPHSVFIGYRVLTINQAGAWSLTPHLIYCRGREYGAPWHLRGGIPTRKVLVLCRYEIKISRWGYRYGSAVCVCLSVSTYLPTYLPTYLHTYLPTHPFTVCQTSLTTTCSDLMIIIILTDYREGNASSCSFRNIFLCTCIFTETNLTDFQNTFSCYKNLIFWLSGV
jgi:hypothetical protein